MICVNIIGGLGNQMFQYAFGCSLSKITGHPVFYSEDMFDCYKTIHNGSELQRVFTLAFNPVSRRDLRKILGWWCHWPEIRRVAHHRLLRPAIPGVFLHEDKMTIAHLVSILEQGADCYLQGYWQNVQYVDSVRAQILRDFEFVQQLSGKNQAYASHMSGTESVSLHVRRGDYVSNPNASLKHGVLPIDYYIRAVKLIENQTGSKELNFFAFSDDLEWVASALKPHVPNLILVEGNVKQNAHFDMHLMSLCKHHIICNSTFSWWGAWLGWQRRKGMVVAPLEWFADGSDSTGLIPSEWCRV